MTEKESSQTEKVPIFAIYKEGKYINAATTGDTQLYELYGFLITYLASLEDKLVLQDVRGQSRATL